MDAFLLRQSISSKPDRAHNKMYDIWSLLLQIYCWTIIALTIISVTLGLLGKTLHIRKIAVRTLLSLFEKISKNVEIHKDADDSEEVETIDPGNNVVIQRDASKKIFRKMSEVPVGSKVFTLLDDSLDFVKAGVECIIEDEVTCRFYEEQLRVWNLLTRTSRGHQFQSWRLTTLWLIGFIFRYFVLLPIRLIIFFIGLFLLIGSTAIAGYIRDEKLRRFVNWHASLISYRVMSRALSIVATYHNCQNVAKPGGICVANHTSPMDVQVLSMDNCYALVGQKQGGLLGLIQRALNRASDHIWFERAEANDRLTVKQRLKEHIDKGDAMPILIFPEGTCINNTSVMMFKKGSFEIEGSIVYPVAIKYDARLGDAFWNSSKQSYLQYVLMLMTSWATVVDVWYLPAMHKEENESGIEFALRVKHAIAAAGGLVELDWDGELKRYPVKREALEKQRERWGRRVNRAENLSMENDSPREY